MNGDDSKAIARQAVDALNAGGSLEDAMREAIKVATLRHHAAERAWLSMQLSDVKKPPDLWMPEDLFILWRQVDAEFPGDRQTPKHIKVTVGKQYADSRALPHDTGRYWSGSISTLEDLLHKLTLLEQNAPDQIRSETELSDLRAVYNGLRERVIKYVASEAG